jgi:phosphoribosylpyrophosphate synthetase
MADDILIFGGSGSPKLTLKICFGEAIRRIHNRGSISILFPA